MYLSKIIDKFKMTNTKTMSTPGDPHTKLSKDTESFHDKENESMPFHFREAVGSLMFAAMVSRPDIAFCVSNVSQFMENPGPAHWKAVKRIFQYLNGTVNLGIHYRKAKQNSFILSGFCDADFAGDPDSRRSTSGYVFMLNNNPITWMTRKQAIVAQSTTEAEYVALAEATKEALWLRQVLADLGFTQEKPTEIFCDNQSAICLVKNPEYHRRTKHIDVRFHFIRDHEAKGDITVKFVSTHNQLADIFTKNLFSPAYNNCVKSLKMI